MFKNVTANETDGAYKLEFTFQHANAKVTCGSYAGELAFLTRANAEVTDATNKYM